MALLPVTPVGGIELVGEDTSSAMLRVGGGRCSINMRSRKATTLIQGHDRCQVYDMNDLLSEVMAVYHCCYDDKPAFLRWAMDGGAC